MSVYRAEAPWRMRGLEPGSGLSQHSVHGPNLRNHETDLLRPHSTGLAAVGSPRVLGEVETQGRWIQ